LYTATLTDSPSEAALLGAAAAAETKEPYPSTPGVDWLLFAILLAGCFMKAGKSFITRSFRSA